LDPVGLSPHRFFSKVLQRKPPLATNFSPVIQRELSEAKNTAIEAMSFG
jgi:hypothetical protein